MSAVPDYDVIVAGGGLAGVSAAIASARAGARTLLVERNMCLGGAATMRNVSTLCGLYTLGDPPRQVVGGIASEVIAGLAARDAVTPPQRFRGVFVSFDPEALKVTLDQLVVGAGVEVLFGAFIAEAQREDAALRSVTLADHGGLRRLTARAFVDCTGDGDLAAFSGASTRYGNPDGINLGTLGTRFGGIPASVTVTASALSAAIAAQGFAPETITKDRCVIVRLPGSGDLVVYLASAAYDPRDGASLSRAEIDTRRQAWAYLEAIREIPGCAGAYLVSTGPENGTREARHLNCQTQLTWQAVEARESHPDCIALGAWGAEWHDRDSFASEFDYPPDKASYEIPLGCLMSADTPNLFCAGRLADADRKAGAAIRVMGTAMATGQAAGCAAARVADGSFSQQRVQQDLRASGAILSADQVSP